MSPETRIILTLNHEDYLIDDSINPIDAIKLLRKLTPLRKHHYRNPAGDLTKEWVKKNFFPEIPFIVIDANHIVTKESEDTPIDEQHLFG